MLELFLIIHILSAAAWIGGGLLNVFAGPRMAKAGGPATMAWIGVLSESVTRFFVPAGVLTALSGIALVIVDDQFGWTSLFVGIGIGVATAGILIGLMILRPSAKKALEAAASGDFPGAAASGQKAAKWGRILVLGLILTEAAMVLRLGS